MLVIATEVAAAAGERTEPGGRPGSLRGRRDRRQVTANLTSDGRQLLVRQLVDEPPEFLALFAHTLERSYFREVVTSMIRRLRPAQGPIGIRNRPFTRHG